MFATAVVFLLIFIFLVVTPLSDKLKELKNNIKQSELALKKVLALQAQKDLISFQCNKFRDYLATSDLSDQENEGWLLKEIEKLSQRAFLSVISLSNSDISQFKDYKIYNADLKAEGGIAEILRFFSYIKESPRLLVVSDFTIAPKDEKASILEFNAEISLYVSQLSISEKK